MQPENFEERKKLLQRFALLYVASIALLVLGFVWLTGREPAVAVTRMPAVTGPDKQVVDQLTTELDSSRQQVWRLRREMLIKDSLIDQLALAPVPDIQYNAFEKQEVDRLQKEQGVSREALTRMRSDSVALREQLEMQVKGSAALKDQVTNLRHNNETLQGRLHEAIRSPSDDVPAGSPTARTAALERQSAQLSDDLRFAEVDCNLVRADARQVIYTDKQRKELLTDALTTLNELVKSPDAEVQKKARNRITMLRTIASTVHD